MDPQERVRAFITDFETEHARVAPLFTADDRGMDCFTVWREAVSGVAERHGTNSFALDGNSFSSRPDHCLATEILGDPSIDGGRARIASRRDHYPEFVEYILDAVGDDWRLAAIHEFFDDPDSPAISPDAATALRADVSFIAPLAPLTDADRPDLSTLFVEQEGVDDGTHAVRVVEVGTFRTHGVLAVGDFGYDLADIGVLQRQVEPTTATVAVSTANNRVAALRVTLTDAPVAGWRLASTAGGFVQGVDYANLAVFDADAAASLTVRAKEALWEGFATTPEPTLLRRDGESEAFGVVTPSGWGDGAYPAYWGVDAEGVPVQLVLDFGVLPGARWVDGDSD